MGLSVRRQTRRLGQTTWATSVPTPLLLSRWGEIQRLLLDARSERGRNDVEAGISFGDGSIGYGEHDPGSVQGDFRRQHGAGVQFEIRARLDARKGEEEEPHQKYSEMLHESVGNK
jgi:hypothetical protein